jgi:hypothetical protein
MLAKRRTMAAKVFISYRRDDSAGQAGRIQDRLEREFGRDLLPYRNHHVRRVFAGRADARLGEPGHHHQPLGRIERERSDAIK